jgi:hypothetical protein
MQSVKCGKKYLYFFFFLKFCFNYMCTGGAVIESWAVDPRVVGLPSTCALSFTKS